MGVSGGVSLDGVSPFDRYGVIPEQSSAYMPGLSAARYDCKDTDAGTCILPMPLTGRLPPILWTDLDLTYQAWLEEEIELSSARIAHLVTSSEGGLCSQ